MTGARRGRLLGAWAIAAGLAAAILLLSTRPNLHPAPLVPHLDKVAHFVEYALLGFFTARALGLSGMKAVRAAILACFGAGLFGRMDEWIQSFVPGRDSSLADWAADSLGAAAGAGVHWWRSVRAGSGLERGSGERENRTV